MANISNFENNPMSNQADPWRNQYPSSVPKHIDLSLYKNIPEVFDEAIKNYTDKKAFTNFSTSMSYSELDKQVNHFASFLQHELNVCFSCNALSRHSYPTDGTLFLILRAI